MLEYCELVDLTRTTLAACSASGCTDACRSLLLGVAENCPHGVYDGAYLTLWTFFARVCFAQAPPDSGVTAMT